MRAIDPSDSQTAGVISYARAKRVLRNCAAASRPRIHIASSGSSTVQSSVKSSASALASFQRFDRSLKRRATSSGTVTAGSGFSLLTAGGRRRTDRMHVMVGRRPERLGRGGSGEKEDTHNPSQDEHAFTTAP